jgi:hypothetical protein
MVSLRCLFFCRPFLDQHNTTLCAWNFGGQLPKSLCKSARKRVIIANDQYSLGARQSHCRISLIQGWQSVTRKQVESFGIFRRCRLHEYHAQQRVCGQDALEIFRAAWPVPPADAGSTEHDAIKKTH